MEGLLYLRHETQGQERVPAKAEEIMPDPNGAYSQNLLPDLYEPEFDKIAWADESFGRVGGLQRDGPSNLPEGSI